MVNGKIKVGVLGSILITLLSIVSWQSWDMIHTVNKNQFYYNQKKSAMLRSYSNGEGLLYQILKVNTSSEKEISDYNDYYKNIIKKIKKQVSLSDLDLYDQIKKIYLWNEQNRNIKLHDDAITLEEIVLFEKGSCLSKTADFGILLKLLKEFNMDKHVKVCTVNNHVFLSFYYQGRRIDIDTIDKHGFDVDYYQDRKGITEHDLNAFPGLFYSNKAGICYDQEDKDNAMDYAEKAVILTPNNAMAHYVLALCYSDKGLFEKAIAEQKKAIEIDPYFSLFYNQLGKICIQNGEYEKGAENLRKA